MTLLKILLVSSSEEGEEPIESVPVNKDAVPRGGSRTAAPSKIELFVIIVNGFQPLAIITKCSILDIAAVPGPSKVSTKETDRFKEETSKLQENKFNKPDFTWLHDHAIADA